MIYSNNGGGNKTKIITLLSNAKVNLGNIDDTSTEQYLPQEGQSHYRKGYIGKKYKYINIGALLPNYNWRGLNLNNFLVTVNMAEGTEHGKLRHNPSACFDDTLYRASDYRNEYRDVDVTFNVVDSFDKNTGILKILVYYTHYFVQTDRTESGVTSYVVNSVDEHIDNYNLIVILNDVEYSSMAE